MPAISRSAWRTAAILGASSIALLGGATGAVAQDTPEYPPTGPSSASAVCIGDIPYLSFTVDFGPEFAGQTVTITLANPEGDDFVYTRTLDSNGRLSGNDILWPGASANPPDWPGWVLDETGNWVEADDGFLWARGTITVTFEVNPTEVIQATYPPATSACANPPTGDTPPPDNPEEPTTPTTSTGLPSTGAQTATLAAVGGGLVLGGAALVVSSRRRATRTSA